LRVPSYRAALGAELGAALDPEHHPSLFKVREGAHRSKGQTHLSGRERRAGSLGIYQRSSQTDPLTSIATARRWSPIEQRNEREQFAFLEAETRHGRTGLKLVYGVLAVERLGRTLPGGLEATFTLAPLIPLSLPHSLAIVIARIGPTKTKDQEE
jgi:hypothetical protein